MNPKRDRNILTQTKKPQQDNRNEKLKQIQQQILKLFDSINEDKNYYMKYGFSPMSTVCCDIPPSLKVEKHKIGHICPSCIKNKWFSFSARLRNQTRYKMVRDNKHAFLIQTTWRKANNKSDSCSSIQLPALNKFFDISFEDFQKSEFIALHSMSDQLLKKVLFSVLSVENIYHHNTSNDSNSHVEEEDDDDDDDDDMEEEEEYGGYEDEL